MIARLCGKLVQAEPMEALVDVQGVGYAVTIPLSTFDRLPAPGGEVALLTWLKVSDDALQLYGFASDGERRLFKLLLTVNGVGAKLALNVLSCMTLANFAAAVAAADLKALSRISGIGKRTAERLVLELKDKVGGIAPEAVAAAGGGAGKAAAGAESQEVKDAVAALVTLGFKADQAAKAVAALCAELPAKEQMAANLIRRALQRLNG
ncbi:MAG: Holliday junction branch migration protein RuvA [Lentisphaeria bacterium]|jgi:Holliday junction DNA helicase RuvA